MVNSVFNPVPENRENVPVIPQKLSGFHCGCGYPTRQCAITHSVLRPKNALLELFTNLLIIFTLGILRNCARKFRKSEVWVSRRVCFHHGRVTRQSGSCAKFLCTPVDTCYGFTRFWQYQVAHPRGCAKYKPAVGWLVSSCHRAEG